MVTIWFIIQLKQPLKSGCLEFQVCNVIISFPPGFGKFRFPHLREKNSQPCGSEAVERTQISADAQDDIVKDRFFSEQTWSLQGVVFQVFFL